MPEAHSEWSASGFKKIMLCPGSKVLEVGKADTTTVYAAEGTAAHQLLEWCLTGDTPAAGYVGRIIEADGFKIEVTDEMADHIQWCVDRVMEYKGEDGVMLVEQRLYYAEYLDVPRETGWGTGDVVIIRGSEITVIDLKYGRGVPVDVEENPQLMLYGLGAVAEHNGIAVDLDSVRLVILQPRIVRSPSEWDTTVESLEAWGRSTARSAVNTAKNAESMVVRVHDETQMSPEWVDTFLRPGEEQCRFCSAKATCPKLREEVAGVVFDSVPASPDEFADMTPVSPNDETQGADAEWLAIAMSKAKLIEEWITAVRAETERRLLAGQAVPGYKLVQGKQGNRQWTSKTEVEEVLKGMRLKQEEMYDRTIISPTTAEKLLAKDSPRRWAKLQEYITRSEGEPHVAPLSDKRPALDIKPVADDFDAVAETFDDLA